MGVVRGQVLQRAVPDGVSGCSGRKAVGSPAGKAVKRRQTAEVHSRETQDNESSAQQCTTMQVFPDGDGQSPCENDSRQVLIARTIKARRSGSGEYTSKWKSDG